MPHSLFISDLHLCADNPRSVQLFERFAADTALGAEALYILGDLFEYWAGDDDLSSPFNQHICDLLRGLATHGTRLFIMHGNRDFLMDEELGSACNATLLDDPALIDLYGTPTLLMHGDTLCTDDTEYQQFRKMVRDDRWQSQFLAQPLAARKALIEQLRTQSKDGKQTKAMEIMDVNANAVDAVLRQHGYPRLIHGHTHRPARHLHHPDGRNCERWVLGDWDAGQASILKADASGLTALIID
jgi:UDP-2,3-diacylglucosamine hydrolase